MPLGVLFAVYDSISKKVEYIPPYYEEIPSLMNELLDYMNNSDDYVLIKAALFHYYLVTIHPFENGNGRTARLLSDYYLDINGYSFSNIGSLEEYFSYNIDEYYSSLQMNLPPLYYDGRNNPPHIEIWLTYYLRMVDLYSSKVVELAKNGDKNYVLNCYTELNLKERTFLKYLLKENYVTFTPKELSSLLNVTNRTIINWSIKLVKSGFLVPNLVNNNNNNNESLFIEVIGTNYTKINGNLYL